MNMAQYKKEQYKNAINFWKFISLLSFFTGFGLGLLVGLAVGLI